VEHLSNPLTRALNDLTWLLSQNLPGNVAVYDHWPLEGITLPCVTVWPVSGRQEVAGVGERIGANWKGAFYRFVFQLDVWSRSPAEAVEIADRVREALFLGRGELGDVLHDVREVGERWLGLQSAEGAPSPTGGERIFRIALEVAVTYAIATSPTA